MTTNFPSGLDAFTNPSATDAMDSATVPHASQHADLNDAVEALQAKVGVDGSAVTTSLDYKVANQGMTLLSTHTIGSGVSSATLSNVFNASYETYRVVYEGGYASNSGGHTLQFRFSSGHTSGYYGGGSVTLWDGTHNVWSLNNSSLFVTNYLDTTNGRMAVSMDVNQPYDSGKSTTVHGTGVGYLSGATWGWVYAPFESVTDLYLFPSTGTITGGKVKVYGYNNG